MGNSFVLLLIHRNLPKAISPWGNRSHAKRCLTVGNSHLPMGKTATATPPINKNPKWLSQSPGLESEI